MKLSKVTAVVFVILNMLNYACSTVNGGDALSKQTDELPIIGNLEVIDGDTIYHTVGDWAFYRQDSALVTEDMIHGSAYVVDFFFTSCPTICPKVTSNMLDIYDKLAKDSDLKLVSFTVDPKRDSVLHLRNYAENLGIVNAEKWWFLTGDKFELFGIADDYFSVAVENPEAEGGFDHSGRILFVDEEGHIRAYADGTDQDEVNLFIQDVATYLKSNDDKS